MWTLAGLLAWTGVAVRYFGDGGMNWSVAAAGLFCIAMGIGAWTRRPIEPVDGGGTPPLA